ncbi:D-alanyl-D-alanine carboxypeptidase/D-alanyl-D-alanine-endopeptidase [Shimia litoralis]|uniref:D-alanyl-D-alanine carboxypeptidase/D-alanyl-D-alanine-endopeptidase n=1 Tax=Shimia litoralis TaxID=420403 RepID=A0A4U7NBL9_9RHOB|nr:D-alanyl-D-alanine carboxypeptidase/D-alanyl-D-alanine-endopeptidase [Shimia litoralis]TKZ22404.1 D-alanyl-D-alanine carboxypeptidase/D-alanyl-D-alanine-endopeptidase [Shimia litoralis]
MKNGYSRRVFLGGFLASVSLPAWADAPTRSLRPVPRPGSLGKRVVPNADVLIQGSGLSGQVAFAVADFQSGQVLEGHQAATGLPPASVTKALTAMYALDVLGAAHRFTTTLVGTGTVSNGVLGGDLVLVGGGDPTLDTNALAAMAAKLKKAGVREVRGQFLVYGGALPSVRTIDPDQPDHVSYSPAISGLSLNFNRVHFEWKRSSNGYAVAMDARSNKYRPAVTSSKIKVKPRDMPVYTYQNRANVDQWTVARGALGKGGARWLPVRNPELYAGDVFKTLARAHGIVLKKPKKTMNAPAGRPLASHKSAALRDILRGMLKYSTNITAEMVGMAATKARGVPVSSLASSAKAMNTWAAQSLGMTHAALVDHSGLGGASRVQAGELVKALSQAARRAELQPILKDIKLRDHKGNVKKNSPVKVQAKTGTLNFVSGLAGYIKAHDGTLLAFAIFAADTSARRALRAEDRERPKGARTWNRKAKGLQQRLIERWDTLYGA